MTRLEKIRKSVDEASGYSLDDLRYLLDIIYKMEESYKFINKKLIAKHEAAKSRLKAKLDSFYDLVFDKETKGK